MVPGKGFLIVRAPEAFEPGRWVSINCGKVDVPEQV